MNSYAFYANKQALDINSKLGCIVRKRKAGRNSFKIMLELFNLEHAGWKTEQPIQETNFKCNLNTFWHMIEHILGKTEFESVLNIIEIKTSNLL